MLVHARRGFAPVSPPVPAARASPNQRSILWYLVVILRRTARFAINAGDAAGDEGHNGFGGRPALRGWGRHFEITVTCEGEPDPVTGYLINIKLIDDAIRREVVPRLSRAVQAETDPGLCLAGVLEAARRAIPVAVTAIVLRPTPTHAYEMEASMASMVVLSQKFEFAAAHRLHAPALSEAENRALFGKCNNPAGHGHNYVIEPRVEVSVSNSGRGFSLADLERVTQSVLIDPFDHKHLNVDTREFLDGKGLNPTVENIARVFFGLLAPAIDGLGLGARLREITVWETDRTSATYGRQKTP